MSSPYAFRGDPQSHVVGTAIHAGHDVRAEVSELLALDDAGRLREEDPHTDRIASATDFLVTVSRSRFEVDLNRSRGEAIYRDSQDAWGLDVWRSPPPVEVTDRSLAIYDAFYRDLATHLDGMADSGPFVVYDIHSYNHRRGGPSSPAADPVENPDVNVGTGSLPVTWRGVVDALMLALRDTKVRGQVLDARENIRFKGRNLARWVHERYPSTGCALALDFKKTFMDEWTGQVDEEHLADLSAAVRETIPSVLEALRRSAP